jgi:hypothetical protein
MVLITTYLQSCAARMAQLHRPTDCFLVILRLLLVSSPDYHGLHVLYLAKGRVRMKKGTVTELPALNPGPLTHARQYEKVDGWTIFTLI